MREFFDLIRSRRSVRRYSVGEVSEAQLRAVLEAINCAPSAGDLQAYEVVIVHAPGQRQLLARAAHDQAFISAAPIVLVFFMDPARSRQKYGDRGASLYACQDATLAAAYAQPAGHSTSSSGGRDSADLPNHADPKGVDDAQTRSLPSRRTARSAR